MIRRAPGVQVPPAIEAFVRKCLEKSPDDRPQSMDEVLRAIAECEQAVFGTTSSRGVSSGSGAGAGVKSDAPPRPPTPGNNEPSQDTLVSNPGLSNPASTRAPSVPTDQARSRAMVVLVAATAVLLVAGVIVARRMARSSSGAPQAAAVSATASASTVAPAGVPRSFVLVLDSTPQGADVLEGDQMIGTTPMQVTIDRASVQSAPRRFVLRLDGYASYTLLQGDSTTTVESIALLVAAASPAASGSAAAQPRRGPHPPAARPTSTTRPDTDIKLTR
jgi:serine/threonine-protein kinase